MIPCHATAASDVHDIPGRPLIMCVRVCLQLQRVGLLLRPVQRRHPLPTACGLCVFRAPTTMTEHARQNRVTT